MNITAAKDVPCVSQTNLWKGYFEAHFMSGREILEKYPILNTKWDYSHLSLTVSNIVYDGYYYCWLNNIVTGLITTDPWYRAFKDYVPISDDDMSTLYHTTVESNPVLLLMYKKKFV